MKGAYFLNNRERYYYFDFLRVAAVLGVIVVHLSAQYWYTSDIKSLAWQSLNFYDSITRWVVPVFIMISGALFLSPEKEIPLRKIYSKYILRLLIALIFWSFFYALIKYNDEKNFRKALETFILGDLHLWFLYMIMGLYMILPFMKKIAASEILTKYFLVLALLFASIFPHVIKIISLFSVENGVLFERFINRFRVNLVLGYSGYFLLGYVLNNISITKRQERIIYFAGVVGFLITIFMTIVASFINGGPTEIFYTYFNVNVICESTAVFVFFKKHFTRENKIIRALSKYSFGAYLVHMAIVIELRAFGLDTMTFNPLFSVPVIAVIVFVISFFISGVLNHIPILKKYIV